MKDWRTNSVRQDMFHIVKMSKIKVYGNFTSIKNALQEALVGWGKR